MTDAYEDEEIALPLLRRASARPATGAELATHLRQDGLRHDYRDGRTADRMRPATAGALMGFLAGAAGLGVVHALHQTPITRGIARLAADLGLSSDAALPAAYLAAGLAGAVVGAGFATITRYLRRFVPLVIWAVVVFVSLSMLLLALSASYGRGLGLSMAPAILLASATYALAVSFQLPLRKRS